MRAQQLADGALLGGIVAGAEHRRVQPYRRLHLCGVPPRALSSWMGEGWITLDASCAGG